MRFQFSIVLSTALNSCDGAISLGILIALLPARVACGLSELGILDHQAHHDQHSKEYENGQ